MFLETWCSNWIIAAVWTRFVNEKICWIMSFVEEKRQRRKTERETFHFAMNGKSFRLGSLQVHGASAFVDALQASGASDRLLSFWLMIGAQSAVGFQFHRAIHHRSSGLPNCCKKNSFRADLNWISTINAMTRHKWWIINCEAQWRCHYGVRCSRSG